MLMTAPLMKPDSDNRNAASEPTSSVVPKRFIGLTEMNSLHASSQFSGSICFDEPSTIAVMIAPGAMALILTPNCSYSTAELRVSPTTRSEEHTSELQSRFDL